MTCRPALRRALRRLVTSATRLKDADAYRIATWRHGRAPRVPLREAFPGVEEADVQLLNSFARAEHASVHPYELLVLCAIARWVEAERVLEIGTFDGGTTLNLAANVADGGRVTTVDLPSGWDGPLRLAVPDGQRNVTTRARIGQQFLGTPYEDRIEQVLSDSAALAWEQLGGPFDVVFIDGCHAYDYVRSDTRNALRTLGDDGIVVWHDYGALKDVSRAVDDAQLDARVAAIRGTRLAVTLPT